MRFWFTFYFRGCAAGDVEKVKFMKEAVIHLGIIPGIGFAYSLRGDFIFEAIPGGKMILHKFGEI